MDTNQNTKGIFFIMTGMAFFSIQDSLIKYIYEDVALFELYFGRTLIQSIILLSFVLLTKKTIILKTHYPVLTLIRVVCFFFGFSFFYISLTFQVATIRPPSVPAPGPISIIWSPLLIVSSSCSTTITVFPLFFKSLRD